MRWLFKMANYAKYWFKQEKMSLDSAKKGLLIEFTEDMEKKLRSFGFLRTYEFKRNDDEYEAVYDCEEYEEKRYLLLIYTEQTQIGWKDDFESLMEKWNIPIQKWMEC